MNEAINIGMRIFEVFQSKPSARISRWFSGSKVVDSHGNPLPVYHGTNQAIDKFAMSRKGMNTNHPTAKMGFYFTDSPDVAGDYAAAAGRNVHADVAAYERKVAEIEQRAPRLERIAQRSNRPEDWNAYEEAMAEWENLEIGSIRADPTIGQNIVPVYLRIINPLVLDGKMLHGEGNFLGDLINTAKRNKHDGLIIHDLNDTPTLNVASTHYVVFSPNQIRSVFG